MNAEREEYIKDQIGNWSFTAHEFTDDELVFAACEMFQHAFDIPGLDQWLLTPGK